MEGAYTEDGRREFFKRAVRELRGNPEFDSAALSDRLQMTFAGGGQYEVDGQNYLTDRDRPRGNFESVSDKYFSTLGLKTLEGRDFTIDDADTKQLVAIVNASFARKHWGNQSALGHQVRIFNPGEPAPWRTIVGVVPDTLMQGPFDQQTDSAGFYMTELFARLAAGATLDQARAELRSVYATIKKDHPEAYSKQSDFQISAKLLRDQITSGARTVLMVLLAASVLVFVVACSNVANLILARTVRREGELAIRTALGASKGALRRMLLAESLLLCGAGAGLGVWIAEPMVEVLARYASRFSVRAFELSVDSGLLWVGVALAIVAIVILAFVPRLPTDTSGALHLSSGSVRISGSKRRQRIFVVTQIGASFVLLAGASVVVTTLLALQRTETGMDSRHVLAVNVPAVFYGKTKQQVVDFYKEVIRRIDALPGVNKTAFGMVAPWRDVGSGPTLQFCASGHDHSAGQQDPRAQYRVISPGFFAALGVPIITGRDFNQLDVTSQEPVAVISQTLAKRMSN